MNEIFKEKLSEFIAQISTYLIILPLAAGFFYFRDLSKLLKQFLLFLLYGGLVDQYCTYVTLSNPVFNFYRLTEGMFYAYFLYSILNKHQFKLYLIFMEFFFVFLFLCTHFVILKNYDLQHLNPLYDMIVGILLSFMSAAIILNLAQRENGVINTAQFWLCLGIFIYSFCTNFIFSLISNEELLDKIWFIHNLINILTYLIFTKAFLVVGKINKQSQNLSQKF